MKYLFMVPIIFSLFACAHQAKSVDASVNEKMQAEPKVAFGGGVAAETRRLIEEAPNLSAQEKASLASLHTRMAGEMRQINEDMGKLKVLLFKSVLMSKPNNKELRNIKNRILSLDRKKTNQMLTALEEVREILGQKVLDDERLYRALFFSPADYGAERP